jgi:hypothetical protein
VLHRSEQGGVADASPYPRSTIAGRDGVSGAVEHIRGAGRSRNPLQIPAEKAAEEICRGSADEHAHAGGRLQRHREVDDAGAAGGAGADVGERYRGTVEDRLESR